MAYVTDNRSLGELFGDLSRDIRTIVRKEVELAKIELSGKASRIGVNAAMIAAGAVVALGGFFTLLAGLVLVLVALGMPAWGAALFVGGIVVAIGGWLAQRAMTEIRRADLTPHETIRTLKENVTWTQTHAT